MAFILIWDNLNIAFKVSEQRHDPKDHLTTERQPILFRFTASNMASFLSSQSEQTVDLSSSLAHKTFSQAERKRNTFKLANFGTSKTFYVMLSPRPASSLRHLSCHRHLFNKFRSIKLNSTHYLLCTSTKQSSRERWVSLAPFFGAHWTLQRMISRSTVW
jgi:hypothetical protein